MPLNVGDRLAHYDVTALIGEGGMGQVYQATDTKLNRRVDGRGVVMSQIRVLVALVVVSAAGFGWVSAQPRGGDPRALTGQDYGEIENLYARYSQGSDFQNAELFLSAFSEDATIVRADGSSIQGMTALRAERVERYQGRTGDVGRRHRTGSYLLTPTVDGAKGRAYYVLLDVTTRPSTVTATGYYDDEFVRTSDGWRIKRRTIHPDVARQ